MELTQKHLAAVVAYDPIGGQFTWLESRGRVAAGSVAGSPHNEGYWTIRIDGRRYLAHRLAFLYMTGAWPVRILDHADRNRRNNAWSNLRPATRAQNAANGRLRRDNRSGCRGVGRHKNSTKWMARITDHGREVYLGLYATPDEASAAYDAAARRVFGEFASLNEAR